MFMIVQLLCLGGPSALLWYADLIKYTTVAVATVNLYDLFIGHHLRFLVRPIQPKSPIVQGYV